MKKNYVLISNTQQWQRDYNCCSLAMINHSRGQDVSDSCEFVRWFTGSSHQRAVV